jgi:hypothetical protein
MELFFGVRVGWYLHPLIVDHDLVVRFDIIVYEHLLAAYHRVTAYLAGIKPAHPNVRQHTVREIKAEIGDVVKPLVSLHIRSPACAR